MAPTQNRLLLAVDGSDRSLQTIRYAGEEEAFGKMKIVLFHVFNSIPEAYYDLEKEPKSVKVIRHVRSWEAQQKKMLRDFMDRARQMLIDAGHSPGAVEIRLQNRKTGVARDIVAEARNGYCAVLTRRRGTTTLNNLIVGSVTNKLLQKLSFIPVLIAGRKPVNKKVGIAVDGSPGADRAVQFVADTLGPLKNYQARLVHVIRSDVNFGLNLLEENGLADSSAVFSSAVDTLTAGGFAPQNITTKTISDVSSRAGAIVNEAETDGWGTIVVGRRGYSSVRDFFIGRVSNKVVYAGREDTVWIVT